MNNPNYISQWHFFISGNHQNRQQSTGLQKAWLSAKTQHNKVHNYFSTIYFPVLPWNYDWYTLARFVQINSHNTVDCTGGSGKSPLINIYAYSWGAGCGAIQLATHLNNVANYEIQNMVLADPVYCSSSIFLRWRAIFANRFSFTRRFAPAIVIPSNVTKVFWNRQFNNWPRAHDLHSLPGSKTVIHSPHLENNLTHSEMDDSSWFQSKVQELCNA